MPVLHAANTGMGPACGFSDLLELWWTDTDKSPTMQSTREWHTTEKVSHSKCYVRKCGYKGFLDETPLKRGLKRKHTDVDDKQCTMGPQ